MDHKADYNLRISNRNNRYIIMISEYTQQINPNICAYSWKKYYIYVYVCKMYLYLILCLVKCNVHTPTKMD